MAIILAFFAPHSQISDEEKYTQGVFERIGGFFFLFFDAHHNKKPRDLYHGNFDFFIV